ncbi:hypothetical protein D3C74_194050 [compost metagenome]
MNINLEKLRDKFDDAFNENSVLFVEQDGDSFENYNVVGLRQSGYLSRPHLMFNLNGAKNHLTGASQGRNTVRFEKNIEVLFESVKNIVDQWDGETKREFNIHQLW